MALRFKPREFLTNPFALFVCTMSLRGKLIIRYFAPAHVIVRLRALIRSQFG